MEYGWTKKDLESLTNGEIDQLIKIIKTRKRQKKHQGKRYG